MPLDPTNRANPERKRPGVELQAETPNLREKEKNLKDYLDGMGTLDPKAKRDFFAKSLEWDRSGDFKEQRRAGRTESEDSRDSMKKYILLSSLYLERVKGKDDEMRFRISFSGNDTARRRVGLGDLLPPRIKSVKVWNDRGEVVTEDAFWAINPENGRIGYYDRKTWEESKTLKYIAVFDNYEFIPLTTGDDKDSEVIRHAFAAHREIYESSRAPAAGTAPGVMGTRLPDRLETPGAKTQPLTVPSEKRERTMQIASNYVTIEGQRYEMGGQWLWNQAIGKVEKPPGSKDVKVDKSVNDKLSLDPITGGPITFLGRPLQWKDERTGRYFPIKVCRYIIPFLKEAEARMRAEGVDYDITNATSFAPREIRGREGTGVMSEHSWGTAIDFNPERNPLRATRNDFPQRFVEIMELCGFKWGGDWRQFGKQKSEVWQSQFSRPDGMHFQFQLNCGTATGVLKSSEARRYAAVCLKDWPETKSAESPEPRYATPPGTKEGAKINNGLNTRITSKLWKFDPVITEAAQKYNVPKNLIMAVMFQESGGDPLCASSAGAGGLMQFMPATAKAMGFRNVYDIIAERNERGRTSYHLDPRDDRADPYKSVMAGARLLGTLLKKHNGNVELALASYNWGDGNVAKYLKGEKEMPKETRDYIAKIPKMFNSLDNADKRSA